MQRTAGTEPAPFPQAAALGPYTLTFHYTPFNHFSLLKSLEDVFDTDEYLGYAGQPGLLGFFGSVKSDISLRD